ncbi:MAG: N-acetyltransferase family protein [Steroidobacteraceae bacterium]|jgi:phosphinothricin acetyltransferase
MTDETSARCAPTIRDATENDIQAILEIYNEVIANTTAVYRELPASFADRETWWRERRRQSLPVLVAVDAGEVVGFASFGDFRAWPCYRHTVEHSVHVRADRRGRGVGSALVGALLPIAASLGKHVMIAAVDAANVGSISMHEKLGFQQVAHLREVGRKFDRWLDLVFLQRAVSPLRD